MGVRKMVYGVGVNDWPTPIVLAERSFLNMTFGEVFFIDALMRI